MAPVQFDHVSGYRGNSASFENRIFRAETGERVQLQKVKIDRDGRHFECQLKLLPEKLQDPRERSKPSKAARSGSSARHSNPQAPRDEPRSASARRDVAKVLRQRAQQALCQAAEDRRLAGALRKALPDGARRLQRSSTVSEAEHGTHKLELVHPELGGPRDGLPREESGNSRSGKALGPDSSTSPSAAVKQLPSQAAEHSSTASTRSPSRQAQLLIKEGDLLEATEDYVVHCCSCFNLSEASGHTARVFQHFPFANVYTERAKEGMVDTPGDLSMHGPVINLYAQFAPGPAMAGQDDVPVPEFAEFFEELPDFRWDTSKDRLLWFKQCLEGLPGMLPEHDGRRTSLAFPLGIGCEDGAERMWPEYLAALREFSRANKQLRVVLYEGSATEEEQFPMGSE